MDTEFDRVSLLTDFRSWSDGLDPCDCDEETFDEFLGHSPYEDPTPWTEKELAQKAWFMAGCPSTGHRHNRRSC